MKVETKIKIARIKLASKKIFEKSKKIAFATVIMQYLIAIGLYYGVKYDIDKVFIKQPITIVNPTYKPKLSITKVETAEAKVEEVKKVETVEETIRRIAVEENFSNPELLVKIAFCESSLNPKATNPKSTSRGLYQILNVHGLTIEERENVEVSTRWTINKIKKDGTSAWNASKHCWNK